MSDQRKVEVYSTPTCPYCRQVKEYLTEKGIAFTDYNVAANTDARNAMVQKSGQLGVPVIDIGGNVVVGFNRAKLEEALGSSS
jgi:glutaredoxin-like YruB-family protein